MSMIKVQCTYCGAIMSIVEKNDFYKCPLCTNLYYVKEAKERFDISYSGENPEESIIFDEISVEQETIPMIKVQCTSCDTVLDVVEKNDYYVCPFCKCHYYVKTAKKKYESNFLNKFQKKHRL